MLFVASLTPKEASSDSGDVHDMMIARNSLCIALKEALGSSLAISYSENRYAHFTKSRHRGNKFHLKDIRAAQVTAYMNTSIEDELEKCQTRFLFVLIKESAQMQYKSFRRKFILPSV